MEETPTKHLHFPDQPQEPAPMNEHSIGEVRPAHSAELPESKAPQRRRRLLNEMAAASAARRAAQAPHPSEAAVDVEGTDAKPSEGATSSEPPPSQLSDAPLSSLVPAMPSFAPVVAPWTVSPHRMPDAAAQAVDRLDDSQASLAVSQDPFQEGPGEEEF